MSLTRLTIAHQSEQALPTSRDLHYQDLQGEAEFALDPSHPLNQPIVDLALAPRAPDGRVHVTADVRILRPLLAGGNRGLFLDVPNRGQSVWLRHTEPGPTGPTTQLTEGFLLRRGYTIVTCGWQHDAPRGNGRFGLTAPLAMQPGERALPHGSPLTGVVSSSRTVDAPAEVLGPFDGSAPEQAYPALDLNDPTATLLVRDDPSGPGQVLPRQSWRFTDAFHVALDGGFQPGKTYELAFTSHAPITGAGFAALRDVLSFLRFAPAAEGNPCAGGIDFAVAMGGSQTGRFLRHFVYGGFCEDEAERLVLDGVLAIAAGARMTEANWRFGQPSTQGPKAAVFPFTDAIQTDPLTGRTDGLLKRALDRGKLPKVFHMNTSSEYVSSAAVVHVSAAIAHLTVDGRSDAPIPDNVRIYHWAGTQHAPSDLPTSPDPRGAYFPNTADYKPFVRAAIDNMAAWITAGVEPPASAYPRLADGTLVPRDEVRARLPRVPGPGLPPRKHQAVRTGDGGFDAPTPAATAGDPTTAPDLIPAVDADGNELGGLRLPDVSIPLATYTAWNPRRPETGAPELLVRALGATIPFARTAAERARRDDPRPSIEERYPSKEAYLARVRAAAEALVSQRHILPGDVNALVEASADRWEDFMRLESPMPA